MLIFLRVKRERREKERNNLLVNFESAILLISEYKGISMSNYLKGMKAFVGGLKGETNIEFEKQEIERQIKDQKVNHILHLILTLLTAGLWLIVWIIVSISSSTEVSRLNRKLKKLYETPKQDTPSTPKQNLPPKINLDDKDKAELKSLIELKDLGILTLEEYEEKKTNILKAYRNTDL